MPATTPSTMRRLRAPSGPSSDPNRSEFISAIGRAPIVKMSRMMPPTPVAAPWYGSMNDGWLCDSILKTAASPSPMSTAPAFSPGPLQHARAGRRQLLQMDARALVAAVLGPHHREDAELGQRRLALHRAHDAIVLVRLEAVTLEDGRIDGAHTKMSSRAAQNTLPGAAALITDSNSTRPSSLPSAASHARSGCGIRPTTLRASLQMPAMLLTEPFGIGGVGDLARRVAVAEDDAAARFELRDRRRDRRSSCLRRARSEACSTWPRAARSVNGVSVCSVAHPDVLAVKLEIAIAQHRPRQQARLEQHLEAVADAEHRPALAGELRDRGHDRREPGDRAGAQIVAVREAAGQDHDVGALQARLLVPDELGVLAEDVLGGVIARRDRSWSRERR